VLVRRLFALAAILAAATWTFAANDAQERSLRQAMAEARRGMSALGKGNVKKAREAFERSLSAVPDFPEAHLGLGHLAMRAKRFEDALRAFREAEAGYESMSAAAVQLEADRYSRSRDELQRLRAELSQLNAQVTQDKMPRQGMVARDATESQVARQRAEVRSRVQALEAMTPPDSSAVREAPAEVLFFEGNALFNLKRIDEAIASWEAALKRNPKLPLAENNLAVGYWMTGRLDQARAAMGRAEALGFKVNPSFRADIEKAIAAKH
jgi:tetratricopeptide (TPR) repeat protein